MVVHGDPARPKTAAPAKPSSKSSSREEGEISSCEETELPSTAAYVKKALDEPILFSSKNKVIRNFQKGTAADIKFLPTTKRHYSKALRTKQVPLKSSNKRTLSWHKKASDDNLVIRFSDDDSGTDSGNSKSDGATKKKENAVGPIKCHMQMPSSQSQQQLLQQPTNHKSQIMPKKGVQGHGSSLPAGKNNGSNVGHQRTSTEKVDQIQKQITDLKVSIGQLSGHIRDTSIADVTVETLRHQIAERENALKVSQIKDQVTDLSNICFEQLNRKLDNKSAEIDGDAVISAGGSAVNSRPIKRMKFGEQTECVQGTCCPPKVQHSAKSKAESHRIHKGESSFLEGRHLCGYDGSEKSRALPAISEGGDKQHDQGNENVPTSKVLLKGLEDNGTLLPSHATVSPSHPDPAMDSKQEANNNYIDADASCSYIKSGKRPVLLDSSYLAQMTRDLEKSSKESSSSKNPTSSLAKTGVTLRTDFVSSDKPPKECSINSMEKNLQDAGVGRSELGILNLESLLELEELQDKELEEAQELRRRCELEERHALKAYRKAQRALINANDRCAILHRRREIISAKLQALMLESSNFMWLSSKQDHDQSIQYSRLDYDMAAKGETLEHSADKSKSHFICGTSRDASYIQLHRHGSCSNQYSEPDDSTSDHRDKSTSNDLADPASFPNMLADDDEGNPSTVNVFVDSSLACPPNGGDHLEETSDVDVDKDENSHDYDLEAALRSKLVARFGMRTSCKSGDISNVEHADQVLGNRHMKSIASIDQQLQGQDIHVLNTEGPAIAEGITKLGFSEHCDQSHKNNFFFKNDVQRNHDPNENSSFPNESCLSRHQPVFALPSSVFPNMFPLLKFKIPAFHNGVLNTKKKGFEQMSTSQEVSAHLINFTDECARGSQDSYPVTCEMSCSMSEFSIDPFWPLCLFELRGKCNNDQCPWQHHGRCSKRNLKRDGFLASYSSDAHFHALTADISRSALEPTRGFSKHILPIPAYYIGSSLIKDDSHFYHSLLARSVWQYWQRGFSASFPLPVSTQRILPQDAPCLQSGDGIIADYDSWSRHSWYLGSQDCKMKKFIQGLPDSEQSLELALDLFRRKVYKSDRKMALSVLARAIEADPSSTDLWVIYLHIFYMKEKGIGKDDMFFHAVQHDGSSYELWLMFINSRVKLNDRLSSYEEALHILCNRKLTCDKEKKHRSAHVLDIFLQMVDCQCMCGNVEEVVRRVYLLSPTSDSKLSGDSLLAEILSCLTIADQCIFWICCIYLVAYKKLPQEIVQSFELEKDLPFSLEWPSIQLSIEGTEQIGELIKFALQKVALDVDEDNMKRDSTALGCLHFLAVSHVRFVSALNGFHRAAELLVKYTELYPTCIELVLLSVWSQSTWNSDVVGRGFEEILGNWPREVPGIHCLWNQHIVHELVKGTNSAENLSDEWFQHFGEVSDPQCRNLDATGAGSCWLFEQPSHVQSACTDHTNLDDKMFGLMNLSLYRLFKNDLKGAHDAVDKALFLASPKYYHHCIREHASLFMLKWAELPDDSHGQIISHLLHNYITDMRFLPRLKLLSRQYYQSIKKPRIRQLIDEIIGPVSGDFSVLNSVLEVCYGPTLLPEDVQSKDLVGFVESLMALAPENYRLALSVYKFTARKFSDSGGIMYWASTILVNSIFQAVPVAPEGVWLEAADLLGNSEPREVAERFYQQAVSVYPFSRKLWKSYLDLSKMYENADSVIEAAGERGIELDIAPC